MPVTTLGRSGLAVSDICLGTMTFGNHTPPGDAFAQMDRAVDAGITFFDCAEMYPVPPRAETVGNSERVIGDWLRASGRRGQVQIATKVSGPGRNVRGGEGFDGRIVRRTVEDSLARLGTDVIDLYQLHVPMRGTYAFRQNWGYDPSGMDAGVVRAHMQDMAGALHDLVAEGKIRAFGVSNESAWGLTRWQDAMTAAGGPVVAAIQNEYSLMDRQFDTDLAEATTLEGVTLLAYSPLAAGMLTGKYQQGAIPDDSRAAYARSKGEPATLGGRLTTRAGVATAAWLDLAADEGLDPVHMAVAFTRQRPFACIPIIGATRLAQLTHFIAGLDLRLSAEQLARIDATYRQHPLPY